MRPFTTVRGLLCTTLFLLPLSAQAATASTPTVNVTNTRDAGPGSLRSALTFAGAHPGTTIGFHIPSNALQHGVALIQPLTPLPPLSADGTSIDGAAQTRFVGNTNSGGPEVMLDGGRMDEDVPGLLVVAARCRVQGLIVSGFQLAGVAFIGPRAAQNRLSGCAIGTDASGVSPRPNGLGIVLGEGAHTNTIGGLTRAERTVVSGNADLGIAISGSAHNTVQGCFIGVDVHGTSKLPNGRNGVQIGRDATDNTIGGTKPGARNLLSGNKAGGCYIEGADARKNRIEGNYIGLDVSGTQPLGNGVAGVEFSAAQDNVIGGLQPGAGNVIADNQNGVHIIEGAAYNLVQGNIIGLDASGKTALPNFHNGVLLETNPHDNLVGGIEEGARNIISGNAYSAVDLAFGAYNNRVQGNFVGLDVRGEVALPNAGNGVLLRNTAHDNLVGGKQAGARNVLSGNGDNGVSLSDDSHHNSVQGNFIGINAAGGLVVPNEQDGVFLDTNTHDNLIGGNDVGVGNVISGNKNIGIDLSGGAYNNRVQGNFIGTTTTGDVPLFNARYAVLLRQGAHDNLIGGAQKGTLNILAAGSPIVFFTDKGTTKNRVEGNHIGVDSKGTHVLLQGWAGVQFSYEATGNFLGGPTVAAGNLIGVTTATKDQYIGNSVEGNTIQNNTPFAQAIQAEGEHADGEEEANRETGKP